MQEPTLPNLTVNVGQPEEPKEELVKSEHILGYVGEIFSDIRENRTEIDEALKSFTDMVMNDGDATAASKEALVNLHRLKSETTDQKTRMLDLLLKAFLKERETTKYFTVKQENTTNNNIVSDKRQLLKTFQAEAK